MNLDINTAFKIFSWGIDYGQLLAEEERESEDWADAFNCYLVARKTAMPANNIPRRQPHTDRWKAVKKQSFNDFQNLLVQIAYRKV